MANNLQPGEKISPPDCVTTPDVYRFLRSKLYREYDGIPDKLIYIPRKTAKVRRITNEDEVDQAMEDLGFQQVSG